MGSYRISRANKSKCKVCPLRGKNKVKGISNHDKPKIVIVGEAPGATEDAQGEPFVGTAGKFFMRACTIAGLKWGSLYKTNVISCRPPDNDISGMEAIEAMEACKKGFVHEIKTLAKDATVFLLAGKTAMEAFGIDGSITKNRGSVYLCKILEDTNQIVQTNRQDESTIVCVPTFHPSFIMRGQWKEEVTWVNDLEKAKNISKERYVPPKEKFNCFPTVADVEKFVKRAIKNKELIGVDIETSGLHAKRSKIWVVGLARNGEEAISVPFYKSGGDKYWNDDDELFVSSLLNELLSKCPTLYQNALFDVGVLRGHGYTVGNVQDDVMLLHHSIHPELKHDLGYIVSVYGRTPYWKDIVLRSEETIRNADDTTLREYNLRDAVVLHQVLPYMMEHVDKVGTYHVYKDVSMKLIDPILTMQANGIKVDKGRLAKFKKDLEKRSEELLKDIYNIEGIGETINFDSGEDLRYLFYGIKPPKYKRAVNELKEYDKPGSRKKKDSKKFRNLQAIKNAVEQTTPFYRTKSTPRKSDAGNLAVDADARLNIYIAANNRIKAIKELVKPEKKNKELAEITRLTTFLDMYNEYQKVTKLLTTYTKYQIDDDERVHSHYMIHGTNCVTGETLIRTSSGLTRIDTLVGDAPDGFTKKNICVQNMKGEVEETSHVFKAVRNTIIELSVTGGINLSATPEHPVWTPEGWTPVENIKEGSFVKLSLSPSFPNNKKVGKAKAFLFGAYLSDGCLNLSDGYSVRFSNCSENTQDELTKAVKEAGYKYYSVYKDYVSIDRKKDTLEWMKLFPKNGAYVKKLPGEVYDLSREEAISFIRGASLDSTISYSSNGKGRRKRLIWRFSSADKERLILIQQYLLQLKITSTLSKIKTFIPSGKEDSLTRVGDPLPKSRWILVLNGNSALEAYQIIGSPNEKHACVIKSVPPLRTWGRKNTKIIDGELFVKVLKKNKRSGTFLVYDLTLPTTHSFITNGIVSHNTGRLSSNDPNLQNVPSEAKKVFVAEDGWTLAELDYKALELRVLAIESDDDILKRTFKEGKDVHSENCKRMFGIDEKDPLWDAARRACKTYIFGRNYGGGLRGIFERVVKAVPELGLTYDRFTAIDRTYRRAHPKYAKWVEGITQRVTATRKLESGVGRVRFFLGTPDEIIREGLNFPIQSLAGDIMNRSLILIHEYLQSREYARLVGTVHDSALLEIRDNKLNEVIPAVIKLMEKPFLIRGEECSFPVDVKTGKDWANLKEYKIQTKG